MERVNEQEKEYRHGDSGPKYLFRGPRLEWGLIRLLPGDSLKAHLHHETEETFYLLEGSAQLVIAGQSHQAAEGDAFRIEPKEPHDIINDSDQPVKLVFIKCPYNPEDKELCE